MRLLLICLGVNLLFLFWIEQSFAQTSKCPYAYFSLRTSMEYRSYFSFQIKVQGNVRLACGMFGELDYYYYKKHNISKMESTIVDELSRQMIINNSDPIDSLYFFNFASANQIKEVDAIAQKGEKYFINYYFNKFGCIKKEFAAYEPAIMKWLQSWCIAANQDGETGCLRITYKFSPLIR